MDNKKDWNAFENTGKIEDYLKYADEERIRNARERFISVVEGTKTNGRDNNSSGNGNILDGYK